MYRLLFGLLIVLNLAEHDWRQSARRRLGGNDCVDEAVTQELSENADPDAEISLVIQVALEPGTQSKMRCRLAGLQLCHRLGADLDSNNLYCNDNYNYIGPDVMETESFVSCIRFVYGVKAGERESVEAIVSEADSDLVVAVSNVDTEITVDACQSDRTSAWGLGFLDRYASESSGSTEFEYDSTDGLGTVAYVIDTGVAPHPDFGNRIIGGINLMNPGSDYTDTTGHGTHVAGTIASSTYGVAKMASIYAINIFGSSTVTNTYLITSAIEHAYERAVANGEKAVINLSLGGAKNSAEDGLVNAAVRNGVSVVMAAGNAAINACDFSPARATDGLTVAASNSGGNWVSFSNYGECVDLIAPGLDIKSTTPGNGYSTLSGTSMAAPHVTGVVCQIMSRLQVSSPAQVYGYITGSEALYSAEDQIQDIPEGTQDRDVTRNLVIQSPCISPGPLNECEMIPTLCGSGTCVDEEIGYSCSCPEGYFGDNCEQYNECISDSPCQENAECTDLLDGYTCACELGYSGDNCEVYNYAPGSCTCVELDHPSWGLTGAYCDTWGNFPVWCYVDPDDDQCDSNESVIPGARWVDCEQTNGPPPTQIPTSPPIPTFNPTAIPTKIPTFSPTRAPSVPTFNPTAIPTKIPTFSPTSTPTVTTASQCDSVECNGGTCVEDDTESGYTCQCPLDRDGEHCETQYVPPGECTCVSHEGSDFGAFDMCHTETQYEPWCYVVGDCEKYDSTTVDGAHWAMCENANQDENDDELPDDLPDVEITVCELYMWWGWSRRCCVKGLGDHPRTGFSDGGCPRNNRVGYIYVPQGARVTVFDGSDLNGYDHTMDATDGDRWQYFSRWISSIRVERA